MKISIVTVVYELNDEKKVHEQKRSLLNMNFVSRVNELRPPPPPHTQTYAHTNALLGYFTLILGHCYLTDKNNILFKGESLWKGTGTTIFL